MKTWMMLVLGILLSGSVMAAEVYQFDDAKQETLFHELSAELRCPTCQNNSLADSNAPLASDLRRKTYEMVQEGKSRDEIVDYMKARYGNFISYEPPLTASTAILWFGPVLFLLFGALVLWRMSKRGSQAAPEHLSDEERARLAALMQDQEQAQNQDQKEKDA
ncbi:Cytochrome c-type biogenesis protein CcmH [Vibrio stylophorae]|uniref:Cytochrome c-type biogenesis protein n=1 Tax=Vibrio stylophorae TaxID=659351 RepID=A0ABN8DVY3_9VIBR|nr:cytochrome c-type biogenesis protein [Vibrio stylophorae]CAH0534075.1 Cytochrome c-type biogenesis protein CcmH [Vibrio stylophorae]